MESYVCLGFCLQGLPVVEIFSQNFHYLVISHSALIFSEINMNVAHKSEPVVPVVSVQSVSLR